MSQPSEIKRKRGGQPKSPESKRSRRLVTNWTAEEYEQLSNAAESLGIARNELVRSATLRATRRALRQSGARHESERSEERVEAAATEENTP